MKKRALFTVPISILLIAVIVTSFLLTSIKPDTSQIDQAKKLAETSKPAVVRVYNYGVVQWEFYDFFPELEALLQEMDYQTVVGGRGSGAIISSDGYVVTNAHVVTTTQMTDDEIITEAFLNLCMIVAEYFQTDVESAYIYLSQTMGIVGIEKVLKVVLPGGDSLDAELKSYGSPAGEGDGKDVAVLKIEGKNFPTLKLGNSDNIENQENIWAIGYPGIVEDPTFFSPDSNLESTMNSGQITATSKKLEQGANVIQMDAAIAGGSSGGPVINEKGEIIGLATLGTEGGGFSFAIPVNTVKEFVNQAGAKNTSSKTDKLFKEGLELFWGGYYKDALEKFESVKRIFPTHSLIDKYIADSEKKMDESKILWSNYSTIFYIVDGVAGLLIIILMLFTFVFVSKKPKVMAITAGGPAVGLGSPGVGAAGPQIGSRPATGTSPEAGAKAENPANPGSPHSTDSPQAQAHPQQQPPQAEQDDGNSNE